jgi:hypothetical protein
LTIICTTGTALPLGLFPRERLVKHENLQQIADVGVIGRRRRLAMVCDGHVAL